MGTRSFVDIHTTPQAYHAGPHIVTLDALYGFPYAPNDVAQEFSEVHIFLHSPGPMLSQGRGPAGTGVLARLRASDPTALGRARKRPACLCNPS